VPSSLGQRELGIGAFQGGGVFGPHAVVDRLAFLGGQLGRIQHVRQHGVEFGCVPWDAVAFLDMDIVADLAFLF